MWKKFIQFYTVLEKPQTTEERDQCIGAVMSWDMSFALSWWQNNVHNGL